MVRRKSAYAIELDIRLSEAVKVLGLNRDTLTCRVKGGNCHTQARHT